MVLGPDFSRSARPSDHEKIGAVLRAAFGRDDEAALVADLRANGDLWQEIVKPWGGAIAGYAAISRLKRPTDWAFLAPIAVSPRFQGAAAAPHPSQRSAYAVGNRLLEEITLWTKLVPLLHEHGHKGGKDMPVTVVTCGDPRIFKRGGFSLTRAANLRCDQAIANLMIARRGDDTPMEDLVFPPALSGYLLRTFG